MITANSSNKNKKQNILNLNLKYFHSAELLTFMLFYEIVYQLGYQCPSIQSEVDRRKNLKGNKSLYYNEASYYSSSKSKSTRLKKNFKKLIYKPLYKITF